MNGQMKNIKRVYNNTAMLVLNVFMYAIENEIDCMNDDDIEECILGLEDALIDEYEGMHPHDKDITQGKVNGMLEEFYAAEIPSWYLKVK